MLCVPLVIRKIRTLVNKQTKNKQLRHVLFIIHATELPYDYWKINAFLSLKAITEEEWDDFISERLNFTKLKSYCFSILSIVIADWSAFVSNHCVHDWL